MKSTYYDNIRQNITKESAFLLGLLKAMDIGNSIGMPINPLESKNTDALSEVWEQVGEDIGKVLGVAGGETDG